MKLTRDITTKIHFIFDHLLPPILRDSKIFMHLMFIIVFGIKNSKVFLNFKKSAPFKKSDEFNKIYKNISINNSLINNRLTDLNKACIKEIINSLKGKTILEVGCGKAFLSNKIEKLNYSVTAVDIYIDDLIKNKYPKIFFKNDNIENLSFSDNSFDTVICTHTLEHVQNIHKSIKELKRVTKKRLIVVIPKQRPYKYTFDLHLHFFPYKHSFLQIIKPKKITIFARSWEEIYFI